MTKHIDLLGILFMAYGALELVGVAVVGLLGLAFGGGFGALGISEGDVGLVAVGGLYGGILLAAAAFELLFAVPKVLVGTALRRRAPWARIGGLVLGCMALMNMPLGTMLGVFALVVLIDKDVAAEFEAHGEEGAA